MRSLRTIDIGVRKQAIIVIVITVTWYAMLAFAKEYYRSEVLDSVVFALSWSLPLVSTVLAIILFVSFSRSGRLYRWWVCSALVLTAGPWLLALYILLCVYFQ